MDEFVEKIEMGNLVIRIFQDEDPQNPRHEYDHVSIMVCSHKRYDLGDKDDVHGINFKNFNGWSEVREEIKERFKTEYILPLFLYDHSGITISVGGFSHVDSQRWDWGQVGFIFIPSDVMKKDYPGYGEKTLQDRAEEIMVSEVKEYDQYLTGDVYGYDIVQVSHCEHCDKDTEETLDSCYGFYGMEYCRDDAVSQAKHILEEDEKRTACPA